MLRDELGRPEILFEQIRRHPECFARVVEPLAAGWIDGKFRGRSDGYADQVPNGQIVLGIGKAPRQDEARIPRGLFRFDEQDGLDRCDGRVSFFKRRLQFAARRHLPFANELDDVVPAPKIAHHIAVPSVAGEIQIAFGLFLVVATVAVFLRERLYPVLKYIGPRWRRSQRAEHHEREQMHRVPVRTSQSHEFGLQQRNHLSGPIG